MWLAEHRRVATVPGSSFYHSAGLGDKLVRFAFPKNPETFDRVEERLRDL
jgi:aspartate/methionine/tyrosine aminotransferase